MVLRSPASDEVTTEATARVQGELAAAGFRVAVLALDEGDVRREVEAAGLDLDAVAAFAIVVQPASKGGGAVAEIWVSDRARHITVVQEAKFGESDHERDAEILAVRSVELLKANLAEAWLRPVAPPEAAPVVATSAAPARSEAPAAQGDVAWRRGLGLGIGAGILQGVGAPGPRWAPTLLASYRGSGGWCLQADFHGLGPAVTLAAAGGTARVEQQFATLDAVKALSQASWLVPFASLSAGLQHLHVSGSGIPPYEGATTDDWSLLTGASLGVIVPLYSRLSLAVQARGVATWPPAAVRIGEVESARFVAPSVLLEADLLGALQ